MVEDEAIIRGKGIFLPVKSVKSVKVVNINGCFIGGEGDRIGEEVFLDMTQEHGCNFFAR